MRCSTVTPGKLATFWRRPVRRLNRVDLPELGGPTMATIMGRSPAGAGGAREGLGSKPERGVPGWQLLMKARRNRSPDGGGYRDEWRSHRARPLRSHPRERREGRRRARVYRG